MCYPETELFLKAGTLDLWAVFPGARVVFLMYTIVAIRLSRKGNNARAP